MTMPQSRTPTRPSLTQDVLHAARYHLGIRWVLLGLGSLAVIAGLCFGGWAWLVAAGLAPLILSVLPCLVMCALGVCMMAVWKNRNRRHRVMRPTPQPPLQFLAPPRGINSPAQAVVMTKRLKRGRRR